MYCKLCQQDKCLCQSHIVPESAYGRLYNDKHRFLEISNVQRNYRILQKGLREPLLCKECEKHLNKYDKYFANVWYRDGVAPLIANQELITITNLEYHRFKLFHMSILWRAGVASREEFRFVDIGQHEKTLRNLILTDNPGRSNQYAFFGYVLTSPTDHQVYQSLVTQPEAVELDGITGFNFVFGGCAWHYVLADGIDIDQYPFIFKEDGSLYLLRIPIDQYNPVMNIMNKRIKEGWKIGKGSDKKEK